MRILYFALWPALIIGLWGIKSSITPVTKIISDRNSTSDTKKYDQQHTTQIGAEIVASGLDVPWEIAWGPDDKIWITEQKGLVSRIDPVTGEKNTLLQIKDVWFFRTAGLLGMAIHPDIRNYPYVFLNYTFLLDEKPFSRLVRYTWKADTLISPKVLLEIAANNGHSGSRLAISNGKLFWATGDAASTTFAQDFSSPNGKILRLNIDGTVPSDNPVKGSPVWAMGFRNIQGMAFSTSNRLYTSEHGDATDDEINLIEKTNNYGWPAIQGFVDNPKEIEFASTTATSPPLRAWTPTIAPAGLDYYPGGNIPQWNNSLLMVSLKGKSLFALKLNAAGNKIVREEVLFEQRFGRLRDICISPLGDVYISTSNRDWNRTTGEPSPDDDRIIKISGKGNPNNPLSVIKNTKVNNSSKTYKLYCASCHRDDGTGLKFIFPALKGSALVKRGEIALIKKIINGSAGAEVEIDGVKYNSQMPSFAFLKDTEIEEIANYVRRLQEGNYPNVNPRSVKRARVN